MSMISGNNSLPAAARWILVAALLLRVTGANFGLPHLYHQDEPIIVNHAMAYGSGDLHPHFFKVPPLLSYLLFMVYGAAYLLSSLLFHWTKDDFALFFFRDPTLFYLAGRLIFGGVLGTASVWLLYRLGVKLFSRQTALLAAAFFASSFLHVRDSHYLYVDIPMIFCLLAAVNTLVNEEGRVEPRRFFLAGVWAGAATAFKYTAAPLFFSLAAAAFLLEEPAGEKGKRRFLFSLKAAGGGLLAFVCLNPYSALDFNFFMGEIRQQATAEGAVPFFHHLGYSLVAGEGVLRVLLGLGGILTTLFKKPEARWLVSFPVVYYLMIAFFSQLYERYAMPLVPFGLLFGAYFLFEFTEKLPVRPTLKRAAVFLLVAAAILPSLAKTLWLEELLLQTDTRTLALQWIQKNVPASTAIVLDHPFFSPRLSQPPAQILQKKDFLEKKDPHHAMREKRIELLLKTQGAPGQTYRVFYFDPAGLQEASFTSWSPVIAQDAGAFRAVNARYFVRYRFPGESDFFDFHLRDKAVRVAVFSPYRDKSKIFTEDPWTHVGLPFRGEELFSRLRPGPFLEIYELQL